MIFVVLRMEADRVQTIGGGMLAGTNISEVPGDSYMRKTARKITFLWDNPLLQLSISHSNDYFPILS